MARHSSIGFILAVLALACSTAFGGGAYYEVSYPPSNQPGQLKLGVTYTLWIPQRALALRGVIVHQHGCGAGACAGGATAAYDLHWQALAKKWNCALLGPSYQQADSDDCGLWSNPRSGSETTFLKVLGELALKSNHPELTKVPWCLWGHSGGGYWAAEMHQLHPERIVAIWLRSGASALFRPNESRENLELSEAALQVPIMCNPGVKEKTDRFARIWEGQLEMFKAYRTKGAPIGFAPDPRTSHECGDSRYLAIPFFDACLKMRLPAKHGREQKLRPINQRQAWLAPLFSHEIQSAAAFKGEALSAVWLPGEAVAKAWSEYVRTGSVSDASRPPAPFNFKAKPSASGSVELTWDAEADFESGLRGFSIVRDNLEITRLPEKPIGHFGRPLFQVMSYHDTPERPLPEMRFLDTNAVPGFRHVYRISAFNSVGLESAPVKASVSGAKER